MFRKMRSPAQARIGRAMRALAVLLPLLWAGPALAITIPLDIEFDDGAVAQFGTVDVTEAAGDLQFAIMLDTAVLGSEADLQDFYFNLVNGFTNVAISTDDMPNTPYELLVDPAVRGGAGSSFDYGVNFGDGGGPPGNGTLQSASFVLSADQPLSIASLLESSFASGGTIEVNVAAHVQSTDFTDADSETVGGMIPVPEAGSLVLMGMGLAGLAFQGRRPRTRG